MIITFLFVCSLTTGVMVSTVEAKREFIRFGGSSPGGSWFVIAGGLSALLNKQIKGINVTPVGTGGSADNNRIARKHELDTWLTHSLTAYDNWNGVGLFKDEGPFKDFRMLCGVYESWHHFVVLEGSDVKKMADLKEKRICIGAAGSGAAVNSENILRALDLWDQVKAEPLTFDACGRGLIDGHIDVVGLSSAPMPAIVTVEALKKIRLIELSDDEIKKVLAKFPPYKKTIMPAGIYKTWQKEYPCIAFQVYWVAHKETDPERVYQILKVAFDPKNTKSIHAIHTQLKPLSPSFDAMKSMEIPLHPGAVKFWREKGESIPPELIPPGM
ncbi:MAG: TAXI family TRAP transporter solute-binding subunit [Pseudomonadota bacterium]